MISLLIVGVALLAALVLAGAGLRQLYVGFMAFEKRSHFLRVRAISAQFGETAERVQTVQRDIESLPELFARAQRAFVAIEQSRSQLQSAARGIGFAARIARAVWDGPKRS